MNQHERQFSTPAAQEAGLMNRALNEIRDQSKTVDWESSGDSLFDATVHATQHALIQRYETEILKPCNEILNDTKYFLGNHQPTNFSMAHGTSPYQLYSEGYPPQAGYIQWEFSTIDTTNEVELTAKIGAQVWFEKHDEDIKKAMVYLRKGKSGLKETLNTKLPDELLGVPAEGLFLTRHIPEALLREKVVQAVLDNCDILRVAMHAKPLGEDKQVEVAKFDITKEDTDGWRNREERSDGSWMVESAARIQRKLESGLFHESAEVVGGVAVDGVVSKRAYLLNYERGEKIVSPRPEHARQYLEQEYAHLTRNGIGEYAKLAEVNELLVRNFE
jgi:hypothetical protein